MLLQVSPDLVSKFNFVAGMVPILQAYIAEVGWWLAAMFLLLTYACNTLIMILQRKEPAKKLTQKRAVIMEQVWQVASFDCFIHVSKCLSKNPHAAFFVHLSFAGPF